MREEVTAFVDKPNLKMLIRVSQDQAFLCKASAELAHRLMKKPCHKMERMQSTAIC